MLVEVIMGRAGAKKCCPLVGPGLNSGRIFVSKARYFGPKLAGFCGPKRAGPKNRLKSHFWLAQSQKNAVGPGPTCGPKNSTQNWAGPKWSPLIVSEHVNYFLCQLFIKFASLIASVTYNKDESKTPHDYVFSYIMRKLRRLYVILNSAKIQ